jgi:hypothetical protein
MRNGPAIRVQTAGTGLAFGQDVRSPERPTGTPTCHWDYVKGPARGGRVTRTMVWICEYPYRTVRLSGPNPEDCEGCRAALEHAPRTRAS